MNTPDAYTQQQTKLCACGEIIKSYQIQCSKCDAKMRYTPINAKWEKFFSEIKQFNPHYKLEYNNNVPEEIIGIIRENPFDNIYVRINRNKIYSNGNYALRISTNAWRHKADRLKKDFDAKDIAKLLHKRCDEILGKMSDEITEQLERERKKKEKIESIKNEFRNVKNYKNNDNNYINFKNTRVTVSERIETLEDGSNKIIPYNTINVNANTSRFSLQQVKDMVDTFYTKFESLRDKKDFTFSVGTSFDMEDIKKVVVDMEAILA